MKNIYLLLFISLNLVFLNGQSSQNGLFSSSYIGGASSETLTDSAHQIWSARYDGPGNDWDEALAIALDGLGNVYVTGGSPPAPFTAFDYATIKYDASGTQQWVARYTGTPSGVDEAFAIAADNSGNVYITGYSDGGVTSNDYATIKYNTSGDQLWVARYNGPASDDDAANAIAVDNSGSVFVTGSSRSTLYNYDCATVKYDPSGNQLWAARYDGPANSSDNGSSVAVDDLGNVYVAGFSMNSSGLFDYITIKYNSAGVQQWAIRYGADGSGDNICTAMAIDGSGNVYVTGGSTSAGAPLDYVTIKYNSAGEELWVARYDGPGIDFDEAKSVKVDASGNVFVSGKSFDVNTYLDFATVKYNSLGIQQWAARYDGPLSIDDEVTGMALDNQGNVYVTGVCVGETMDYDFFTFKYNTSGEEQWMATYNGTGNMGDKPFGIAVDAAGYVYVAGYSYGETSFDYATVKYGQTVVPVELVSFSAVPSGSNVNLSWTTATETNNKGFLIERKSLDGRCEDIGFVNGQGTTTSLHEYSYCDRNIGTGSYSYRLKQVDFNGTINFSRDVDVTVDAPSNFALAQNYPNPFNPSTTIEYTLPSDGFVTLDIYNALGQHVASLVKGSEKAGVHKVVFNAENLSSGMYYYRIETGSSAAVRKMMLMK